MQHVNSTASGNFSVTSLKRTRSGEVARPSPEIPPLPDISPDLVLEVYTHESLRPPNATRTEGMDDNSRLAVLGENVLKTAVGFVLFSRKPHLSYEDMKDLSERLSNTNVIQGWVKSYQMASRLLCSSEFKSKRDEPEECRKLFCAYVGAVFTHSGQEVVVKWIELLVHYYEQQSAPISVTSDAPPTKKVKNEPINSSSTSLVALPPTPSTSSSSPTPSPSNTLGYSPVSPYLNASQSYASAYPVREAPPHMSKVPFSGAGAAAQGPLSQSLSAIIQTLSQSTALRAATANMQSQKAQTMTAEGKLTNGTGQGTARPSASSSLARPNPLAPATPNAPFLPLFNQSASQRGVKVEYATAFEGPQHAGQWAVECLVNGIPKGKGKGGSKQLAKEEAARQAYYSMGWT